MSNRSRKPVPELSSIHIENIIEIIDDDGLNSLIKLIELKVEKIGNALLTEDLSKNSFAELGIKHAKYQGAQELRNFMNN